MSQEKTVSVTGPTLVDEGPPSGSTVILNTVCQNQCGSQRFRITGRLTIVCVGCDAQQNVTPEHGAQFWATRRWQIAS